MLVHLWLEYSKAFLWSKGAEALPYAAPELPLGGCGMLTALCLQMWGGDGTLLKTCSEEMWAARFLNWRGTNLKTGKYFTMIAQEKQDYQEWD